MTRSPDDPASGGSRRPDGPTPAGSLAPNATAPRNDQSRAGGTTLAGSLRPRGPIQLAITTHNEPHRTVVGVGGELDILTVSRLSTRLDEVIRRRQGTLVIDLSEAEFIDSMGLHALLNVQRRLVRQGRTLVVICPPGAVRHAIELARLAEPLGVISSAQDYEPRCASPQ